MATAAGASFGCIAGGIGFILLFLLIVLLALGLKVAKEWERMPVLRFGKFIGFRGPGLFFIIPFVDTIPVIVDIRTIPLDVSAQRTLTKDNIPVVVDAIIFFKVQDTYKAVFKIKDYYYAIGLAATPLLRDTIGKMVLDDILAHRDEIAKKIEKGLDKMTHPWGIDVESVEIRDVTIPRELEESISRVAGAERERRARTQLAMAEKEIATTLVEAARNYQRDPISLELRSMNMLYEMCMQGKATTIFIPTETALQMRSPIGMYGVLDKLKTRNNLELKK
jgi:regulator of protease activity HflC (stomatin/prohibitin superfamily)